MSNPIPDARPTRLLFVCSRNRLRSPTGEAIYQSVAGFQAASVGTAPDAEERASPEWIEWADVVLCMEARHKKCLVRSFPSAMRDKRTLVLGVLDDYDFMDPQLVSLLSARVDALLGIDASLHSNPAASDPRPDDIRKAARP